MKKPTPNKAQNTPAPEPTPGEEFGATIGSIAFGMLLIPLATVLIAISIRLFCFILHCQHLLP